MLSGHEACLSTAGPSSSVQQICGGSEPCLQGLYAREQANREIPSLAPAPPAVILGDSARMVRPDLSLWPMRSWELPTFQDGSMSWSEFLSR